MPRILLIDDNQDVVEYVGEILQHSMQIPYDVATNVEDARKLLVANGYDCILLDLEIPPTSNGERARPENGIALFKQTVKIKGEGVVPIILMTSYTDQALAYMKDLHNDGLVFGMPKNLWNKGRPPETAIREAMDAVEQRKRQAQLPRRPLKKFTGGTLVIVADGATLCGRVILDDSSLSPMRELLLILSEMDNGAYRRFRRRILAKRLDTTVEALNGVIFRFRDKVIKVLADECGLLVELDDVVRTKNGDHINEKIIVEIREHETLAALLGHGLPENGPMASHFGPTNSPNGPTTTKTTTNSLQQNDLQNGPTNGPTGVENGPSKSQNGQTDEPTTGFCGHVGPKQKHRLLAILEKLKDRSLTRDEIQAFAAVGRSQVTRDLAELERAGLVRRAGPNQNRLYALTPAAAAVSASSSTAVR